MMMGFPSENWKRPCRCTISILPHRVQPEGPSSLSLIKHSRFLFQQHKYTQYMHLCIYTLVYSISYYIISETAKEHLFYSAIQTQNPGLR